MLCVYLHVNYIDYFIGRIWVHPFLPFTSLLIKLKKKIKTIKKYQGNNEQYL